MGITFRDVKNDLLEKITNQQWPPGTLMPNEAALADEYGCARATVNRAMRELADDGIIERKRKAGTRVRMAPVRHARFGIPIVREEIEALGSSYRYALVSAELVQVPDWLRARLNLAMGQAVMHVTCMHYADGAPYQYEDRWINPAVTPQVREADFSKVGPNEWLVEAVPFSDAEIGFTAVEADAVLAEYLGCAPGAALFRTERTTWLQDRAVTLVFLTHRQGHRMTARY